MEKKIKELVLGVILKYYVFKVRCYTQILCLLSFIFVSQKKKKKMGKMGNPEKVTGWNAGMC
jgi:hypothetical protein